ncbi:hypothetical protein [Pedobacter hartonius]|uniref:Cytochrome c domain-containing protein n=1 Tax=Pedobacter hartonius TaxID=425514 RepID=A0A1H4DZJ0_9SPHI|nr:hypothetical protein [Pedobacter hartonius]SEA77987.1 hypothetical protein SAMN05443550_105167 [Pedobacter hartonius]
MIKQKTLLAGITIAYLLLAACTKKQAEELKPAAPGAPVTAVSYATDIGPLFQTKCNGCHAAGRSGSSSWTFNGYNSVVSNANRINNSVLVTKSMPLGGSLTSAELQSVKAWFDQGMPQ